VFSWPLHAYQDAAWECPAGLDESVAALRKLTRWSPTQDFTGRVEADRVKLYLTPPLFIRTVPTVFYGAFEQRDSGWVLRGRFATPPYQRAFALFFTIVIALMAIGGPLALLVHWQQVARDGEAWQAILAMLTYLAVAAALFALVRYQTKPKPRHIAVLSEAISRALQGP
jgi:hypothetical protein